MEEIDQHNRLSPTLNASCWSPGFGQQLHPTIRYEVSAKQLNSRLGIPRVVAPPLLLRRAGMPLIVLLAIRVRILFPMLANTAIVCSKLLCLSLRGVE